LRVRTLSGKTLKRRELSPVQRFVLRPVQQSPMLDNVNDNAIVTQMFSNVTINCKYIPHGYGPAVLRGFNSMHTLTPRHHGSN